MATRTLSQKLFPLSSYLLSKNLAEYLETNNQYILGFSEIPEVLADWSDAIKRIKKRESEYKINNLQSTSERCQLFNYMLDYYWCNNKKGEFDLFIKVIVEGFVKYPSSVEIDFSYIVSSLRDLNVNEDYIIDIEGAIRSRKELPIPTNTLVDSPNSHDLSTRKYSIYFKLLSLYIYGHKNINGLEIDFTTKEGITVLIGNNGCGKSNLIEAIVSIFAGLYRNRIHKPDFDYDITYHINGYKIFIKLKKGNYSIEVNGNPINKAAFEAKRDEYLPKNIVACYSGESGRLFNKYFGLYYKEYINAVKKADKIPELPFVYINKYCWNLALLTLCFYDFSVFTDIAQFCKEILKIKKIKNVQITLDLKKLTEWKENSVILMIKKLANTDDFSTLASEILSLSIDEIRARLNYMSEKEFFETMYAATMPKNDKVIKDIKLDIILDNGIDSKIDIDDLSEGEKKHLLMRLILESIGDENSLLLFDEPDAHIHVSRKEELKKLFKKFEHRENIITTHSPTLAMCFDECNLESLGKDKNGNALRIAHNKQELISSLTNGMWSAHEQNMFLASNKNVILLVEGSTDKTHFNNAIVALRQNYPDLEFDVFYLTGADNIAHFVTGLRTCNMDYSDKKIIAIFDNDKEGRDCCNQTQVKFINKKNKHGLYAIEIPKLNNEDTTIENYYDKDVYFSSYIDALNNIKDKFHKTPSEMNKIIEKEAKSIICKKSDDLLQQQNHVAFDKFKGIFDIVSKINQL